MTTRWVTGLMALALLAGTVRGQDESGVEIRGLLAALRSRHAAVRREAECELARIGPAALDDLEEFFREPRGVVHRPGWELAVESADRLRRAFLRAEGISILLGGALFLTVEDAHLDLPPHLVEPMLEGAFGSAAEAKRILAARRKGREVVARFVREWNELNIEGEEEQKRYDALRGELEAAGPAALPPLLQVLAIPSAVTFANLHSERGVTARMQVRAILGLRFLNDPLGAPAFYLHTRSISFTAAAYAGAALRHFTGDPPAAPLTPPDREKLDAWWAENRGDHLVATAYLARRLVEHLERFLARESLGLPGAALAPAEGAAAVISCLEMLTAQDLPYDEEESIEVRLDQASRIAREIQGRKWR